MSWGSGWIPPGGFKITVMASTQSGRIFGTVPSNLLSKAGLAVSHAPKMVTGHHGINRSLRCSRLADLLLR